MFQETVYFSQISSRGETEKRVSRKKAFFINSEEKLCSPQIMIISFEWDLVKTYNLGRLLKVILI